MAGHDNEDGHDLAAEDGGKGSSVEEEGSDPVAEEVDVRAITRAIIAKGKAKQRPWKANEVLDFGDLRWQPHLVRQKPKAVLHIHDADRLRSHVLDRMAAAQREGYEVHVAITLGGLYDEQALVELAKLDATIHLIRRRGTVDDPAPILRVLAMERMTFPSGLRSLLAGIGWDLSQQKAPKHRKGRRFESVILFLLSQVEDFRVVGVNMRTRTEELDVVVQQRATQGRCWATIGAPFILVEAKNWKENVDQPQVSILLTKMRGKRRTVRIGLMFAASDFTVDAKDQELRFAAEELTIVFLNGKEIEGWIAAPKGDDYLEQVVQRAMLR